METPNIEIGGLKDTRASDDEPVSLLLFTDEGSILSKELVSFAQSFAASNPGIGIEKYEAQGGKNELLQNLKIEYWPCLVIKKGDFTRIRYYGVPGGYEISPLSDAIKELKINSTRLSETTKKALVNIRRRANIKIFVLTTCTFCPVMARIAYRVAIESPRITAEIIDSAIFAEWSQKHLVMGVPKVILNDNTDITGAVSEEQFVEKLRDADHALIDNIYG